MLHTEQGCAEAKSVHCGVVAETFVASQIVFAGQTVLLLTFRDSALWIDADHEDLVSTCKLDVLLIDFESVRIFVRELDGLGSDLHHVHSPVGRFVASGFVSVVKVIFVSAVHDRGHACPEHMTVKVMASGVFGLVHGASLNTASSTDHGQFYSAAQSNEIDASSNVHDQAFWPAQVSETDASSNVHGQVFWPARVSGTDADFGTPTGDGLLESPGVRPYQGV